MKEMTIIANYFYPEFASVGQLMTELCRELQNKYKLTVIAALPSYTGNEEIDCKERLQYDTFENIRVIRVRVSKVNKESKFSRLKYISTYFFNALLAILKEDKPDIIFAISQPPILGGWIGVLGKFFKRTKLVYCIEDFNPEQIEAVGYTKKKILIEIARMLDNATCKYADKIVVVGRDMQQTAYRRIKGINRENVAVINNWIDEKEIFPLPKEHAEVNRFILDNNLQNSFVVMYSGNIGLFYDLENIIKVFGKFKEHKKIHFVFIGEGAKKNELMNYVSSNGLSNISFLPYQPKEKLVYSLNAADIHLVANQKGIKGVSVPSKIYGVMAAGKPVFGILENGSEAEMLVRLSECGVVVQPGDYTHMENIIEWLYNNRELLPNMGMKGREYLEKHLTMEKSMQLYSEMFEKL